MQVPFVDLKTQFTELRGEILPAIESVLSRTAFILGEEVAAFEKAFAAYTGTRECVGVATGCDAILWALKACGVGPGDEVITVANSFIATALAITMSGAKPVLVDCLPDSYEIDPAAIARAITPRTKALVPVHLYGQPADMDPILDLAKRHGLVVIEDAAQAHGATYKGRPCGSLGHVGCFSFYPGKNLGAYGDGGAITTNDPQVADRVRMYRNYGQRKKYYHEVAGWNSRLDTVQAAVLLAKLKKLDGWNDARRRHADQYRRLLADLPLTLPIELPAHRHIYHLFVVQTDRRDDLLEALGRRGVSCGIHYPVPIHLQEAYRDLNLRAGSFPVAERVAGRLLSLPMYPELREEQVDYVCACVRESLG